MAQYALIMLLAGIGIPILAALNAALGTRIGSPAAAASMLFLVALLSATTVMIVTGSSRSLLQIADAPRHLLLAGVLIAFYVLSITWVAPRFGVGSAVFFVLLGQLISAAAIDHFGLFGAQTAPLTALRAGGITLMAIGVWITQLG